MSGPVAGSDSDPFATLPPLRAVIARHGLAARHSLGQHFLLDLNLTARIARAAAPLDGHTVFEVGPGPGGLTRALLAQGAAEVVAVEKDPRCLDALAELAGMAAGRLRLVEADALELDLAALAAEAGRPAKIVANLPYNVGTPLLIRWLARADAFARLTLMFQKEVADRLAAAPRTKAYGRLSVLAQWRCRVEPQFNLPSRAFTPPPKVASTVVNLDPRPEPLADVPMAALERVTAAAFGQRRKMLRQSLKSLGMDVEALLAGTGIAPTARAEELGVEAFCALARRVVDG